MTRRSVASRAAAPDGAHLVRPVRGVDPPEHLTTGWEPHLPLADGVLRRFVYAYAASLAGPVAALGGRVTRGDGWVAHDLGRPAGYLNGATLLAPLPFGGWERTVEQATAALRHGEGSAYLWSPWPTPDLSKLGWQLEGHPPAMLRLPGEPAAPPPPWLRIERVTDAGELAAWEHVAVTGYPFPECRPGELLGPEILDHGPFEAWVGYVDDEPVAAGASYLAHRVNVFALGVTLPSHRGRGAWPAMAHRRLAVHPRLPAMSLFSDFSRGPAEGLGFIALARWSVWVRARG